MAKIIKVQYEFRDGTAAEWTEKNTILRRSEPGREIDTGKIKFGDGINHWDDLPYFAPGSGGSSEDLEEHINSETPHPFYDDTPSLELLYENAKV